jgi:hypothetical protein
MVDPHIKDLMDLRRQMISTLKLIEMQLNIDRRSKGMPPLGPRDYSAEYEPPFVARVSA